MAAKKPLPLQYKRAEAKWRKHVESETKNVERKQRVIERKKKNWDKYVASETQRIIAAKRKPYLDYLERFVKSEASELGVFRAGEKTNPFGVPVFEVLYKVKGVTPHLAEDICNFVQERSREIVPLKIAETYGLHSLFLVRLDRGVGVKGRSGFFEVDTFDFSQTSEALNFILDARARNMLPVVCFAKLL